jgi:hypothetical protein
MNGRQNDAVAVSPSGMLDFETQTQTALNLKPIRF